ncbi:hypothetical protein V1279_000912 [Bradyrhizobium sp. AZCC 1610]|uniref:hypothetical protein n=1 Tax=Bradyrhizobium sp. AZCC 1610 TaxID=3117020 RepID=UPI002FF19665
MAPKSQRKEITQAVVDEALARASRAKDSKEIHDYFDTTQRYLQLRQRGRSVSWFVRAKGQSRRIGSASQAPGDREFLSLKAARRKAGEVFFAMKPRSALNLSGRSGWTWAELDRQYQASLKLLRKKGKKIKRPSKGTQDDVRLCFGKPEFVGWRKIRLADLTDLNLIKLIGEVHTARGSSGLREDAGLRQGRPVVGTLRTDDRKRARRYDAVVGSDQAAAAQIG